MANTLKLGAGNWATKESSLLAYNDENGNFKPLPFDFTRDSGATRVNKEGLIEVVSNNEPRIDFLNDSNGALLLEPQRSNLFPYSQDFSQGWGRSGWTLSSGFISPDGTDNAYSILRTTGSSFAATLSLLANTKYTFTVYIKNINATNIQLRVQNQAGNTSGTEDNCVVFSVTNQTNTNNYTRITHTFNTGDAGSYGMFIGYFSAGEYIVYGAQLEQGSYATSYIPTNGSAVTRVAETCTGAGDANTFNDSEGVLFAEIAYPNQTTSSNLRLAISDGTTSNRILIQNVGSNPNRLQFYVISNGGTSTDFYTNLSDITSFNKIAFKYKENDFSVWINGIKVLTDTIGSTFSDGTLNKLAFDGGDGLFDWYGKTKQIQYFDKALTDAELQALTS